jgi:long-chain acyl-CoA synthetase
MGTVGPIVPETEIRITDDQNRTLGPGRKGVVKARGPQVMKGYYKRDELTAEVLGKDGFLDTGDLGMITYRGELKIIGRTKETIVLLGGENVEPNPIEDRITASPFISQVMVVGQDQKVLGALVVPDVEAVREHFRKQNRELPEGPLSAVPAVVDLMKAEMARLVTAQQGFRPFEKIGRVRVLDNEFKVGAELTHTLKKKRNVIYEKYAREIAQMYA